MKHLLATPICHPPVSCTQNLPHMYIIIITIIIIIIIITIIIIIITITIIIIIIITLLPMCSPLGYFGQLVPRDASLFSRGGRATIILGGEGHNFFPSCLGKGHNFFKVF